MGEMAEQQATKPHPQPAIVQFLEHASLHSQADDHGKDEEDAITVSTIHTAKGLEWAVVFVPGLEDGVLPHQRSIEMDMLRNEESSVEEERRLLYVGHLLLGLNDTFQTCRF
jgi:DNA helicase-2/ATP-dependent DNA helicase PcrA